MSQKLIEWIESKKAEGFSSKWIEEKLLKTNHHTFHKLCKGGAIGTVKTLKKIAAATGLSYVELIGEPWE